MLPRPFGVLRLYSHCSVQLCPHHRALKPRSPPHPKRFPHGRRTGLCRGEDGGLVPPHQGCSEWADHCANITFIQRQKNHTRQWREQEGLELQSGAEIPASRFGLSWGGTKPKPCLHHKPPQSKTICLGSSLHVWLCLCFLLYF